jgi:hypothetical protein
MSRNKKPRKPYRPRPVTADTMALAKHHACKPERADIDDIVSVINAAWTALRQGVATQRQWTILGGTLQAAVSIHELGVVRDIDGHLRNAEQALQTVHDRAMRTGQWQPTPLYFHELDTISIFIDLHTYQLRELGRACKERITDRSQLRIRWGYGWHQQCLNAS